MVQQGPRRYQNSNGQTLFHSERYLRTFGLQAIKRYLNFLGLWLESKRILLRIVGGTDLEIFEPCFSPGGGEGVETAHVGYYRL